MEKERKAERKREKCRKRGREREEKHNLEKYDCHQFLNIK